MSEEVLAAFAIALWCQTIANTHYTTTIRVSAGVCRVYVQIEDVLLLLLTVPEAVALAEYLVRVAAEVNQS